mmetsp:Transcript_24508/g.38010  ORF Transcript_24508/g.38010 Transcript_24508/m.38010 type:complete len:382 (-) Transcript_24508:409-1554(-)
MYDTLSPDAQKYIIDQTQLTTIAISSDYIAPISNLKLADSENLMKSLANLVVFESDITDADKELAAKAGIKLITFAEVEAKGREIVAAGAPELVEPTENSCVMFSYTSGTTGVPKGVKLTHKMLISQSYAGFVRHKNGGLPLSENDTYISYLPAAHSFEQFLFGISLIYGMRCASYGGNVLKLVEDIQILKPTYFPSVPRLLNRIYGKIAAATGDMSAMLGGKVRCIVTGSAPIAGDVLDFLAARFNCIVIEGYGLTETTGGSVITMARDKMRGIVGGPCQNVKLKLRDLPDMDYLTTDSPPRGEIMFWSPGVMQGYFKNPEKTAEAFDGEWFKSGDVGMILPNGAVKIVDRVKNIFKLSQGEYLAPEKIENIYVKSKFIA